MPKKRSHGDGALYSIRGGALWRGVVDIGFDADGKRVQKMVHARTKRAANEKLKALQQEIAEHGAPLDKQRTVAQWSETWLETIAKPDIDPKTYSGYASLVRRWIIPTIGTRKLATLKPSAVREVRTALADAGRSTSMARQAHVVLTMILEAARVEGLCRTNVAKDVRAPGGRREQKIERTRGALSTEQTVAILAAAARLPPSTAARWWFKILTGPRQGEVLGAVLEDLDRSAWTYTVNWKLEEIAREHGCGGTCGFKRAASCPSAKWRVPQDFESRHLVDAWHLTPPKSKRGRVIPFIPQLADVVRLHLEATADLPNPYGLIWRRDDGSPILPKDDGQQWRELLVTAGVIGPDEAVPGGTHLTGHWTRHTAVTILASLGVDMQLIGEIVGHSAQRVTEIYRHAQLAEKKAALELLGGAFSKGLTVGG